MDADEQKHPIESHREHVFLAAGAGSGKTRVLVSRYLRFLEVNEYDPALPARMLAITFTEKAALEMQERVLDELRRLSARAEGDAAARLRLLEREMEAAPISTIHGFCSRLLREHAVEAGLDPLFRVPDEVEQHALREAVLDRLFAEEDEDLRLLAGELGLDALREGLAEYRELRRSLGLDFADLDPEAEPAEQEALARRALRPLLDDELRGLPARLEALCAHFGGGEHPDEKGRAQLAEATAILRGGDPGAATLDLALKAMKRISQSNLGDEDRFKKAWEKLRKGMQEIQDRYGELDHPAPPDRPRGLRRAAFALAARGEALYRAEMRARGWLDFEDLQHEALRLLETRPELRERLREQYRQIFVDEFQDTNPLQLRLLRALMPEDEEAGQRALFLVGDHRQSIYSFRNADLDVFLREGERMAARGEKRELRLNWRSRARLIDFFNEVFPHDDFPPMEPAKEDGPEPRVLLQMTAQGEGRKRLETRKEMAEGIAEMLWQAHESGLEVRDRDTREARAIEWSDMALLLRSGTLMGTLARALAERGIPYEAVGGRDYFLRQELRDLEDLVAALDDPFHRLKLARALRGDIIGLSSADLLALLPPRAKRGERDGGELLNVLMGDPPATLSEDGRRRLDVFRELYREFRSRLHRESLSELIPALVRASGFEIQAATGPWGLKVQRNLRQLADLVGELEANGPLGVRDFLDYMDRVRELSPRREEAWVPEEGEKTLRILTVHSAKGLEFPLVVLPDLDREISGRQHEGPLTCLRTGGEEDPRAMLGLRWKGVDDEKVEDAVQVWIARERSRREAAELRRLLYVACTRARDWLVLAGVSDERVEIAEPDEQPRPSFLNALRETLAAPVRKGLCRVTWTGEDAVPVLGPGLARTEAAAPAPVGEPAWDLLLEPPPDPGRPELAVTSLSALGACPLRWMLEKRLGLRGRGRSLHAEEGPPRERFGGAEFGTLVHGILQHWDFRAEPEAAFEAACPPGLDGPTRARARELLLAFFARGGAWIERLARAEKLRREESFTLELENLALVGQVDLVLEADGQRFLVDWKSDDVDAESAKERRHHYEMQMALYALALEKAGRPADRAFLAFLRPARFLEVKIEAQNLRWAAARAEKLGALAREMSRSEAPAPPQDPPCRGCPWRDGLCPESYRGG